jgi:hypothetical protein
MRNILLLIGGAAALFFISRFRFGQKAVFNFRSLRPGGTLFAPVFNVDLAVSNPTNQTIVIKSITGTVNVKGSAVANVSAFGDQRVAANSESILKLQARPSAVGVFETVRELLKQPVGSTNVSFTGTANVDGIVVPVSESKMI